MNFKYQHGVLGGTFDHLHIGHEDLLNTALNESKKISIGLGTEKIYHNKLLKQLIESYPDREENIKKYLNNQKRLSDSRIIALNDVYGTTLIDDTLEAIFVTEATLSNAEMINKKRLEMKKDPLKIIVVPLRKDDEGEIISSERIRSGEIDRKGLVYFDIFKNKRMLILPDNLREALRHPIGEIISDPLKLKADQKNATMLITVGDIVTKSLNGINLPPDIAIVDFKTQRHTIEVDLDTNFKAKRQKFENEAGTIQKEVVSFYKKSVSNFLRTKEKQAIIIEGEEDLLTLPAVLLAPLDSLIFYGQFDLSAMIMVRVTEEKKKIIYDLIKKFE